MTVSTPTATEIPGRIKHEWPDGKIRYTEYSVIGSYPWGRIRLLDENGNELCEQILRVKPTDGSKLEMQLVNAGGAGADLVLDDNGLWTSAA